jgi:cell division septation protein DedD
MHLKDIFCTKTILLGLVAVAVILVPNFWVNQVFFLEAEIPVTLPNTHLKAPIEPFLSQESEHAKALFQEVDQYWQQQQKAAAETVVSIDTPNAPEEKPGKIRIPWVLSIEDFQHYDLAHPAMDRLKEQGWRSFIIIDKQEGVSVYRVLVGPYIRYKDALTAQEKIKTTLDLGSQVMSYIYSEETAIHSPEKLDD